MRMSSDESNSENSEPEESPKKKDEDKNGDCDKTIQKLSERDQKQCTLERCLPRVNCQEYIVFVLDLGKEEDSSPFQLSDGTSYSFLALVKKVFSLFIQNKSAISPGHKYALMVLHESPLWVVDFTTNPRDIINEIEALKEKSSSSCDLSQIFDLLQSCVTLPPADNQHIAVAPPQYIVRMIFVYGRSLCLPQFLGGKESFSTLVKNPHFFLDVLYVHEVPKEENKCEDIFDLLCDLDETGWSYIFEVGRNPTKLHNLCSKLLAHPLQRPCQDDTRYTLLLKD